MPQIANITVKKNDGITDVTYTAVVPSAGDRSAALWRSQTVGSAAAQNPNVSMTSRFNDARTARRVELTMNFPSVVTGTDGIPKISDKVVLAVQAVVPLNMPTVDVNEAVSQLCNVVASTLVKDSVKTGFAPT